MTALQAGEVDMIYVNEPEQAARLRQDKNMQVFETPMNSLVYVGFNARKSPFDDVRVRQALAHMINKPEIVQTALGGLGQEAFAPLSPTLHGFDAYTSAQWRDRHSLAKPVQEHGHSARSQAVRLGCCDGRGDQGSIRPATLAL